MQRYNISPTALPNLPSISLAIGNFDGVHLAHQAILTALKNQAITNNCKAAVLIFEPQPREFFDPQNAPPRLDSLDEKCEKFSKLGIEITLIAHFDNAFANVSAEEFVQILHKLNVKTLIIGDDFRFGKGRTGDKTKLTQAGFNVQDFGSILIKNQRISSTAIRQFLEIGDLQSAKTMLGTDYSITGEVIHGNKIGRTLNFPTANIAINRIRPAVHGVFGVAISIQDGFDETMMGLKIGKHERFGCANIGTRPSINGQEWRLEVHLPNFVGDLYGKTLTVRFLHFLHSEKKYPNLNELQQGIANDVHQLLNWYTNHTNPLT